MELTSALVPNRTISRTTVRILIASQVAVALLIWINSPFPVLPQPGEVAKAFRTLWFEQGLGRERFLGLIGGARVQESYNLVERGLAWREGVATMPEFLLPAREIRARFPSL